MSDEIVTIRTKKESDISPLWVCTAILGVFLTVGNVLGLLTVPWGVVLFLIFWPFMIIGGFLLLLLGIIGLVVIIAVIGFMIFMIVEKTKG